MSDETFTEKRDFIRIRIDTIVNFTIKSEGNQIYQGDTYDLSGGGLKMVSSHQAKVGDEVQLEMKPSDDKLSTFSAEGTVIRSELDEEKQLYNISIQLSQVQ